MDDDLANNEGIEESPEPGQGDAPGGYGVETPRNPVPVRRALGERRTLTYSDRRVP